MKPKVQQQEQTQEEVVIDPFDHLRDPIATPQGVLLAGGWTVFCAIVAIFVRKRLPAWVTGK